MKKVLVKKCLLCFLITLILLQSGCGNKKNAPELYLDESIPETPITIFTQNEDVSNAIEDSCRQILNQDKNTNIVVYSEFLRRGGPVIPGIALETSILRNGR